MPDRYRALVFLGCYGGSRIGGLAGLDSQNVDPARGRLKVVDNAVEVRGALKAQAPKTRAGRWVVVLPPFVVNHAGG